MASDRGGVPRYALIAAELRRRIVSGELGPGSRLPSEPAIVDEWGVSKTTAARALDLLSAEGLIIRVSGSGSFVAETPEIMLVEAGPGARISAQAAEPGELAGAPPGTPVLIIERPGTSMARYRADLTVVVVTCDHASKSR